MRLLNEIFLVSTIISMLIVAGAIASALTIFEELENAFKATKEV